jgi:hypothetical protein
MLKPAASMNAALPMMASGMVSTGMMTARNEPMAMKITSTTTSTASARVFVTSSMDA